MKLSELQDYGEIKTNDKVISVSLAPKKNTGTVLQDIATELNPILVANTPVATNKAFDVSYFNSTGSFLFVAITVQRNSTGTLLASTSPSPISSKPASALDFGVSNSSGSYQTAYLFVPPSYYYISYQDTSGTLISWYETTLSIG